MAGETGEIDAEVRHIDLDLPERLHHIRMNRDAPFMGDICDIPDGHHRARLVIGIHNGNEDRILPDGVLDIVGINEPETVDRKIRNGEPLRFEIPAHIQDRGMLNRRRDNMAFIVPPHKRCP